MNPINIVIVGAISVLALLIYTAVIYANAYGSGRGNYRRAIRSALRRELSIDLIAIERAVMTADGETMVGGQEEMKGSER